MLAHIFNVKKDFILVIYSKLPYNCGCIQNRNIISVFLSDLMYRVLHSDMPGSTDTDTFMSARLIANMLRTMKLLCYGYTVIATPV